MTHFQYILDMIYMIFWLLIALLVFNEWCYFVTYEMARTNVGSKEGSPYLNIYIHSISLLIFRTIQKLPGSSASSLMLGSIRQLSLFCSGRWERWELLGRIMWINIITKVDIHQIPDKLSCTKHQIHWISIGSVLLQDLIYTFCCKVSRPQNDLA